MVKYYTIPPHELAEIREQLYQSSYNDLAEATGYSKRLITHVLNGDRRNQIVVDAAKKLIELHRDNIQYIKTNFHRSLKK